MNRTRRSPRRTTPGGAAAIAAFKLRLDTHDDDIGAVRRESVLHLKRCSQLQAELDALRTKMLTAQSTEFVRLREQVDRLARRRSR